MRFTLTTSAVVAALALSPGAALANTDDPPNRVDADNHATTMHSLAVLHEQLEARAERIASPVKTAPTTTARIVATDSGFDWVDGAIGAGLAATVLLLAAGGVESARRHPTTTTR
jgi:hypothetical protein